MRSLNNGVLKTWDITLRLDLQELYLLSKSNGCNLFITEDTKIWQGYMTIKY